MQKLRALETPGKQPRLSLSEAFRLAMTRHTPPRESIDLERGMRGEIKIVVSGVAQDSETLDELLGRVAVTFERGCARFPMASGYVRANGGEQ